MKCSSRKGAMDLPSNVENGTGIAKRARELERNMSDIVTGSDEGSTSRGEIRVTEAEKSLPNLLRHGGETVHAGGFQYESEDDAEPAMQGPLGRVLSRITTRSSYDPGPPPDGGWLAWSQCKSAPLHRGLDAAETMRLMLSRSHEPSGHHEHMVCSWSACHSPHHLHLA